MFNWDMVENTTTLSVGKFSITTEGYLDIHAQAHFIGKILDENKQSIDNESKFPTSTLKAVMRDMIDEANQIIIAQERSIALTETEIRTIQLRDQSELIPGCIDHVIAFRDRGYDNMIKHKLTVTYLESRLGDC